MRKTFILFLLISGLLTALPCIASETSCSTIARYFAGNYDSNNKFVFVLSGYSCFFYIDSSTIPSEEDRKSFIAGIISSFSTGTSIQVACTGTAPTSSTTGWFPVSQVWVGCP
jgi:hypothetical protein